MSADAEIQEALRIRATLLQQVRDVAVRSDAQWWLTRVEAGKRVLGTYSVSNENFVPVNIALTSSDLDSDSIDEKIKSTDDCAIEPVEQAGSGAVELGVWFERFQNRTG